jgi:hypothetical protein
VTWGRRHKRDGNHADIVAAFEQLGYLVKDISQGGDGLGDLLVYRPDKGLRLIEVKAGAKAPWTAAQKTDLARGWPVLIVRAAEDVID